MRPLLRWLMRAPAMQKEERMTALEDPRAAIAFGNKIIFFGIGSFLVWGSFAPLDEGVPASGVVVVESHRKIVAHLTGGTIADIRVKENQLVKEGDVLLTLDATRAQTTYTSTLNEYIAAAGKVARLSAEQSLADKIAYPDELVAYAETAGRRDLLTAQDQLFRIRKQALANELSILQENLSASHGQATGIRLQLAARNQQVALLREEHQALGPLVGSGYAARNKLLETERQIAELTSVVSELQARVAKEVSNAAEIRLRLLQRRQEFQREVEGLLADARREAANLEEKLKDASLELDHTTIRAPVSGQVIGLQAGAPGSIVTPGSHILEVVPHGDLLLIDVQVPTHLIARIHAGLPTDIRVSAFTDAPQLTVDAKVQSISSDRFEPPNGQPPYYLARVEVTEKGLLDLKGRQLRPGMPVEVVIKTGERSFLAYVMRPLMKRMFSSLQEP